MNWSLVRVQLETLPDVAQFGSAIALGAEGRGFKSLHLDITIVAFRQHKTLIWCFKTTLEEIRMVRTLI